MLTRPPSTWWTAPTTSPSTTPTDRRIHFLHPGYSAPSNVLFSLPALDRGGIHHGVALSACTIIAGNAQGWLSTSPSRRRRALGTASRPWDEVLMEGEYWFHLVEEESDAEGGGPWPVCPEFGAWLFPHRLPGEWEGVQIKESAVPVVSCAITACSDGVKNAFIVPGEELEWFSLNSMSLYNADQRLPLHSLTTDTLNTLPLRADLHLSLSSGTLVIVPKESAPTIHLLTRTSELAPLYHNRTLHPLRPRPAPEFLYARFAHSVFPLLAGFLGAGERRVCTAARRGEWGRSSSSSSSAAAAVHQATRAWGWEVEWVDWGDIVRWRTGVGAGEGSGSGGE